MNVSLSSLLCVLAASIACADPSPEEEAFLCVPNGTRPPKESHQTFRVVDLPKGIVQILQGYDCTAPNGILPAELRGFKFDLNKDGKVEYFFATTYGGSGGPHYLILSEMKTGWEVIGDCGGSVYVMLSAAGWPDLVVTSRGGGGVWAKVHYSFRDQKYVLTMIEHYNRGKITTEVPKN